MRKEHRTIGPVSIRNLSARDEAGLRAMFGKLSGEMLYKGFHMPFPRVPEPMLAHLMGHGGGRSLVAVAGGEIVGHALYAEEPGGEAEVAVVVEDGWQSGGIGKLLLAGARHTLRDGSHDIYMPLRGLRSVTKPGQEMRPAA